ncbi:host attachment protein [Prosthecomicrobium pneumaticum]|uniref:Protein required for attachment to host cells n=1 Tax=Prosthecomicrobium pneumaticum TaxID=81895 RepID=A0A7W9FKQ5_9HYPH|nr:host attachment family protein [Prosthecomicrobium pneumaticum]MBB5751303.1 protein required for attachment to host cells [Prosthecomicrobium pneumaticum]
MDRVRIPWKSWVVVCDGAKALAFRNEGDSELVNLWPVDVMLQPNLPARALGTDRPGRSFQSHGAARSALADVDRHEEAEEAFLAAVAEAVDKAVAEHSVRDLILVAPPRALGVLRKHLAPTTKAIISAEIGKDLVHLSTYEIQKHLVG